MTIKNFVSSRFEDISYSLFSMLNRVNLSSRTATTS